MGKQHGLHWHFEARAGEPTHFLLFLSFHTRIMTTAGCCGSSVQEQISVTQRFYLSVMKKNSPQIPFMPSWCPSTLFTFVEGKKKGCCVRKIRAREAKQVTPSKNVSFNTAPRPRTA
jgi:hypothetical protein